MAERERPPDVNPFSTRFVRPGAIDFLFGEDMCATDLVRRLAALGWSAQIVGPHGSGKSALVATLVDPLARARRRPCVFSLRDRERRMPTDWVAQARHASAGMIVVDGYERLSRARRPWIRAVCRRNHWGLLVTAHKDAGLPTLVRLDPDLEVARAVVKQLAATARVSIPDETIVGCYHACGGNLRETLFALYDWYERERPARADVA